MAKAQSTKNRGLPKRVGRPGWQARFTRYKNNNTREKNKAKRIVKDALRSSNNPVKIAIDQARKSAPMVITFVRKILNQKGM